MFMVRKESHANNYMAPIFANYEWWVDLAQKALAGADEFEMRLWQDDFEGIESAQRF